MVFKIYKSKIKGIERYIRNTYVYFMRKDYPIKGVKIIIGKEYITIRIQDYYCIICNDLIWLYNNNNLIANKKSINWLLKYIK